MAEARELLAQFVKERNANWIPDDLPPLDSTPRTSEQVTDDYLADLAAKHGCRFATLDRETGHSNAEVIA
jgi:hypothetical protein